MNIHADTFLHMFAYHFLCIRTYLIWHANKKINAVVFYRTHGILVGSLVRKLTSTGKNFYITKWVLCTSICLWSVILCNFFYYHPFKMHQH